jgi:hypothetical protein
MNWSLTWVLDNAPLQNEARPPKLMAGTFFQQGGSVQQCSGPVEAFQPGTQPYQSGGFTKNGQVLVYRLSVPLIIGTTVSTCVGQGSGTLRFAVLPTAPLSIAYADVGVLDYVPPSPLGFTSTADVRGDYTGVSQNGGLTTDIHWTGVTLAKYPPSRTGYYNGPSLRPAPVLIIINDAAGKIRSDLSNPNSQLRGQGALNIRLPSAHGTLNSVSATLVAGRTVVARGKVSLRGKRSPTLHFSLTPADRRSLRGGHGRGLIVKLTITGSGTAHTLTGSETLRIGA